MLLARPTYRDSVINGKALAGVVMIAVMLAAAFLVTMAVLLLSQIVPSGDDLYRILGYFIVTLLFMVAIFALSLLASTFSHTSKTAVLFMLGIFVFMYILASSVDNISNAVMGPPPENPQQQMLTMTSAPPVLNADGSPVSMPQPAAIPQQQDFQEVQRKFLNDTISYYSTKQQITDMSAFLSPMESYNWLTSAILNKHKQVTRDDMLTSNGNTDMQKEIALFESMADRWTNLIALLVIIGAAFGLSYLAFMRSDVT
jgi:ABC-2 type transport system permease protein